MKSVCCHCQNTRFIVVKNNTGTRFGYQRATKGEAFIIIEDSLIDALQKEGKITIIPNQITKSLNNLLYQINCQDKSSSTLTSQDSALEDSKQTPTSPILMHIVENKYVLIDNNGSKLVAVHKYGTTSSVKRLAQHIGNVAPGQSVHHKMETFDNRKSALQAVSGRHSNHGSHQFCVTFPVSSGVQAFNVFVEYIQDTAKCCHRCNYTQANCKTKYMTEF